MIEPLVFHPQHTQLINSYGTDTLESCQESSALHFITSLGVPDVIGENSVTLAELSTKLNVQPRFISEYLYISAVS